MVTVNTYNIYITGTLDKPVFQGDIDPATNAITILPLGTAMISIELVGLIDSAGEVVTFDAGSPLTFDRDRPEFVCWDLLSPTQLQVGDINYGKEQVGFTLITNHGPIVDPTIVNTYQPPPGGPGDGHPHRPPLPPPFVPHPVA